MKSETESAPAAPAPAAQKCPLCKRSVGVNDGRLELHARTVEEERDNVNPKSCTGSYAPAPTAEAASPPELRCPWCKVTLKQSDGSHGSDFICPSRNCIGRRLGFLSREHWLILVPQPVSMRLRCIHCGEDFMVKTPTPINVPIPE